MQLPEDHYNRGFRSGLLVATIVIFSAIFTMGAIVTFLFGKL